MISYIAIFSWPIVALILIKRMDRTSGLIWSIVAGFLLLPHGVEVDLPLLPAITKGLVATLPIALYLGLQMSEKPSPDAKWGEGTTLPGFIPKQPLMQLLLLMLIGGAALTVLTNQDRLIYGPRVLTGLSTYDAFSSVMNTCVALLPFFLARKYLAHPDAHRKLLWVFCLAALIYSLPALYEVRMSPQLNRMVYGFFPHEWRQHLRAGGFRPVVFLNHGLVLGLFLAFGILSALAYMRTAPLNKITAYLLMAGWLLLTLVLSKNLGPLMIVILLAPMVFFLSVPLQLRVATVLAATVLIYPILRGADIVPVDQFVGFVKDIDPARAGSANFRFENEDILLEKANERPVFGWGGWGRSRVFDDRGRDISVTDGFWVITIGEGGWIRYLGQFGLLTGGIILLYWHRRKYEITPSTAGLCLVLCANLVDLIPNAAMTQLTALMAGALAGRAELGRITTTTSASAEIDTGRRSSYSRSFGGQYLAASSDKTIPDTITIASDRGPVYTRQKRIIHRVGKQKT